MNRREYLRALPADVPGLEASGWRVAAATTFAAGEVSVLLVRPLADRKGDTDRDEDSGLNCADRKPNPSSWRDSPTDHRSVADGDREQFRGVATPRAVDREVQTQRSMTKTMPVPTSNVADLACALGSIDADVEDLCGLLHVISQAAAQKGDRDLEIALRLAARHAEQIADWVQRAMQSTPTLPYRREVTDAA
jgi:hypothetical protein